jgi:NAD(P)-dependent dehydrogenase (short-subunit alcohol dehydrogenase family)
VQFEHGYERWQAYGQAKTANVLFAVHLDSLARDGGVRAFALHPGAIHTNLVRYMSEQELNDLRGRLNQSSQAFKTPEQGAATQVWAATSPQLDGMGGVYLENCDIAEPATGEANTGVRDYAIDPDEAARLWTLSADLTGVNAFA